MDLESSSPRASLSTASRSLPTTAVKVMKKTVKVVTSAVAGFTYFDVKHENLSEIDRYQNILLPQMFNTH